MSDIDEDDDPPQLSAHALAALQEFYSEKTEHEQCNADVMPKEDWQLSQFWYDDETSSRLANEAISAAGVNGSIACISSPTAYKKIQELKSTDLSVKLLEFDDRFNVYGDNFVHYDYNEPLSGIPQEWKSTFDVVIVDPPFLSQECLCNTAITVKFLVKEKIILCTGAVMEEFAERLLGVKPCFFRPRHTNKLQNEFKCFANFKLQYLDKE